MARISGDAELRANLRALRTVPSGKALDLAMSDALDPMKEQTRANALTRRGIGSRRGGHLDEGIVTARVEARGPNRRVWWISFKNRARKIAHLVEFGTAPHWQPNFRGGWMHPGARPFPFMRPAFEAKKGEVTGIIGRRLWAGVVSAIRGVKR